MNGRLLAGLATVCAAGAYAAIAVYGAGKVTRRTHLLCDLEPGTIGSPCETVRFRSRDGLALEGWWFPAEDARRALVLVHGHGQNRIDRAWGSDAIARAFTARGYSVLLFDLRGHGASAASRQSFGVREKDDVLGALDFAGSRGFSAPQVAFLGVSFGAASLLMAAAEMPDAGPIVADSAYAEIWPVIAAQIPRQRRLLALLRPGRGIRIAARVLHGIDLRDAAPLRSVVTLQRPILFIHGAVDGYVPPIHGERLRAGARHPATSLWLVPEANHAQTYMKAPDEFIARVAAFFDEQMAAVEPVPAPISR